ncbi:hypothetical protein HDU83_007266, partial [Entophlyctis luteolus]
CVEEYGGVFGSEVEVVVDEIATVGVDEKDGVFGSEVEVVVDEIATVGVDEKAGVFGNPVKLVVAGIATVCVEEYGGVFGSEVELVVDGIAAVRVDEVDEKDGVFGSAVELVVEEGVLTEVKLVVNEEAERIDFEITVPQMEVSNNAKQVSGDMQSVLLPHVFPHFVLASAYPLPQRYEYGFSAF